jgi:hypothetical protein
MREIPGGHASTIHQSPQSPEMEALREQSHRLLEESPQAKGFPTDEHAIAVKDDTGSKHELDKRSLDYVLRTGLAGGMAGCAVR